MNSDQDSWAKVVEAWLRDDASEPSPEVERDDSAPMGFSTRVVARWQAESRSREGGSWLSLLDRCALPGACLSILALVLLFAFAPGERASSSSELFAIPDIQLPGSLH